MICHEQASVIWLYNYCFTFENERTFIHLQTQEPYDHCDTQRRKDVMVFSSCLHQKHKENEPLEGVHYENILLEILIFDT